MPFGWRCVLVFQIDYNKKSSSKESDFTIVVASTTRHLLLSPSAVSCGLSATWYHQVPIPARISTQPGSCVSTPFHSMPISSPLTCANVVHYECGESLWKRFWACQLHSSQGAGTAFLSSSLGQSWGPPVSQPLSGNINLSLFMPLLSCSC